MWCREILHRVPTSSQFWLLETTVDWLYLQVLQPPFDLKLWTLTGGSAAAQLCIWQTPAVHTCSLHYTGTHCSATHDTYTTTTPFIRTSDDFETVQCSKHTPVLVVSHPRKRSQEADTTANIVVRHRANSWPTGTSSVRNTPSLAGLHLSH